MKRRMLKVAVVAVACMSLVVEAPAQGQPPVEAHILQKILKAQKICKIDNSSMKRYTVSYREYVHETPGSFESFGWVKSLNTMGVSSPSTPVSVELFAFSRLSGGSTHRSCEQVDASIAAMRAPVPPGATCKALNGLAKCVVEVEAKHLSHVGRKNVYKNRYDPSLGVYDPAAVYKPGR